MEMLLRTKTDVLLTGFPQKRGRYSGVSWHSFYSVRGTKNHVTLEIEQKWTKRRKKINRDVTEGQVHNLGDIKLIVTLFRAF